MNPDPTPTRLVLTALDADPAPLSRLAPSATRRDVTALAPELVPEVPLGRSRLTWWGSPRIAGPAPRGAGPDSREE